MTLRTRADWIETCSERTSHLNRVRISPDCSHHQCLATVGSTNQNVMLRTVGLLQAQTSPRLALLGYGCRALASATASSGGSSSDSGSDSGGARVAIVGSGPSGFYTAKYLLRAEPASRVKEVPISVALISGSRSRSRPDVAHCAASHHTDCKPRVGGARACSSCPGGDGGATARGVWSRALRCRARPP